MTCRPVVFLALSLLATPLTAQTPSSAAARAEFAFAVDLYRKLAGEEGNLFFSPHSVHTALAMTREGAAGETAKQMDAVLHLLSASPGKDRQELATALQPRLVNEDGKMVPTYALNVANSVWGQQDMTWRDDFNDRLERLYAAPIKRVDFRQTEAARKAINAWCAENTNDRIQNIVPPGMIAPNTAMALANAIWFKAAWATPFSERGTAALPFHLSAKEQVDVPTMRGTHSGRIAAVDGATMFEIPYRGNDTAMLIVLPDDVDGLAKFERDLTAERLAAWAAELKPASLSVSLPKFKITHWFDLSQTLTAMGMRNAFSESHADFSGMSPQKPLFITNVLHKAFVAVDEVGTEAAAATVVLMKFTGRPAQPIQVTVDRPFWFAVRHRKTGALLFTGRVADPRDE